jgi:hypothetical protein
MDAIHQHASSTFFSYPTVSCYLSLNSVDSFSKSLDVTRSNTSDGKTTISGTINRVLPMLAASTSHGMQFTSFAKTSICSAVKPVYANIPI